MTKSTLIVMPTGTGKTVVMAEIVRRWQTGRILLIAHREELVHQASEKISSICFESCAIEMADSRSNETPIGKARVVVASVQTLSRGARLHKFNPHEFGLVLTDEAHHATAKTYRKVYDHFKQNCDCRFLGVTATPDRADEEALGQIYDSVAFEYDILTAINDGWLVPVTQEFVHVEGLDLSKCLADKNDLKDADVARVMNAENMLHRIAHPTFEIAGDRQTLVFAASVEQAQGITDILNRYRSGCAAIIHGKTDSEERRDLVRKFQGGDLQFLCNMGVFLEGFDAPVCSMVSMARPTKSRSLYAQVAGRGMRPLPGIVDGFDNALERVQAIAGSAKKNMVMLDFVGNSGKHKLVCTADILGGNVSDEILDLAVAKAKAGGKAVDMKKLIEETEEEVADRLAKAREKKLREAASKSRLVAKTKYSTKNISPFELFDMVPQRTPGYHKGKPPSQAQVNALRRMKVDEETIGKVDFVHASQLLGKLVGRMNENKCTYKQAKILSRYGYSVESSFQEANSIIDKLAANGWKPV